MMNSIAFLLAGGVCERFPDLRIVFLEANGGWIVPWLERLDHHARSFTWDVPWLQMDPSEYFRRQCWISFDPDESALGFSGELAARRRRPHRVGDRLPASRREVPRRDRGAARGDDGSHGRAAGHDRGRELSGAVLDLTATTTADGARYRLGWSSRQRKREMSV